VIMATNPTLDGDGTALYLANVLGPTGVRITRLARGLPSGSVLEFANNQMLADALEGRRAFSGFSLFAFRSVEIRGRVLGDRSATRKKQPPAHRRLLAWG